MSRRIGSTSSYRRATDLSHPFPNTNTNNKKLSPGFLDNIKTKKFLLVHGEGFGAWCWHTSIALLEESVLHPISLDLTGSGIDKTDTNNVTTLADYSKPLIDFLQKLPEDEHLGSADFLSPESKSLIYGNGKDNPPIGFTFEKQHMHDLYFNQSPAKDVALAMVSMRPIPLGPMMETLSLSAEKYGSGRHFYIHTLDDHALSPDVQESLVRENPPQGVFKIKGSDHCPFFSKPQSLHKIFIEIAQIP